MLRKHLHIEHIIYSFDVTIIYNRTDMYNIIQNVTRKTRVSLRFATFLYKRGYIIVWYNAKTRKIHLYPVLRKSVGTLWFPRDLNDCQ